MQLLYLNIAASDAVAANSSVGVQAIDGGPVVTPPAVTTEITDNNAHCVIDGVAEQDVLISGPSILFYNVDSNNFYVIPLPENVNVSDQIVGIIG